MKDNTCPTVNMHEFALIILGGGVGSRLGPMTKIIPKPGLPFAGKSRIIDFPIFNGVNSDIPVTFIMLQHAGHQIARHIENLGLSSPAHQKHVLTLFPQHRDGKTEYLGTADAVLQHIPEFEEFRQIKYFIIVPADHVCKMDYREFAAHFKLMHKRGVKFMIAGTRIPIEKASEYGIMSADENSMLKSFVEKPANPEPMADDPNNALASMGVYVVEKEFLFKYLRADGLNGESKHDFGRSIIPKIHADEPETIATYDFCSHTISGENGPFWLDVGQISDYFQAHMDLLKIVPPLSMYNPEWPILTATDYTPGAKFNIPHDNWTGDESLAEMIAIDGRFQNWTFKMNRAIITGQCIFDEPVNLTDVVSSKGVRVGKFSELKKCIIHPNASIGENCSLKNTIILSGCKIPDNTRIGHDENEDKMRNIHIDSNSGVRVIAPENFS